MELCCPNCGKVIEASAAMAARHSGTLVCPQCLSQITVPAAMTAQAAEQSDDETQQIRQQPPMQPPPTPRAKPPEFRGLQGNNNPQQRQQQPWQQQPQPQQPATCRYCRRIVPPGHRFCPHCGGIAEFSTPHTQPATARPPHNHMAKKGNVRNKAKKAKTVKGSIVERLTSVGGCLTFTVLLVALFFIIYIAAGTML